MIAAVATHLLAAPKKSLYLETCIPFLDAQGDVASMQKIRANLLERHKNASFYYAKVDALPKEDCSIEITKKGGPAQTKALADLAAQVKAGKKITVRFIFEDASQDICVCFSKNNWRLPVDSSSSVVPMTSKSVCDDITGMVIQPASPDQWKEVASNQSLILGLSNKISPQAFGLVKSIALGQSWSTTTKVVGALAGVVAFGAVANQFGFSFPVSWGSSENTGPFRFGDAPRENNVKYELLRDRGYATWFCTQSLRDQDFTQAEILIDLLPRSLGLICYRDSGMNPVNLTNTRFAFIPEGRDIGLHIAEIVARYSQIAEARNGEQCELIDYLILKKSYIFSMDSDDITAINQQERLAVIILDDIPTAISINEDGKSRIAAALSLLAHKSIVSLQFPSENDPAFSERALADIVKKCRVRSQLLRHSANERLPEPEPDSEFDSNDDEDGARQPNGEPGSGYGEHPRPVGVQQVYHLTPEQKERCLGVLQERKDFDELEFPEGAIVAVPSNLDGHFCKALGLGCYAANFGKAVDYLTRFSAEHQTGGAGFIPLSSGSADLSQKLAAIINKRSKVKAERSQDSFVKDFLILRKSQIAVLDDDDLNGLIKNLSDDFRLIIIDDMPNYPRKPPCCEGDRRLVAILALLEGKYVLIPPLVDGQELSEDEVRSYVDRYRTPSYIS